MTRRYFLLNFPVERAQDLMALQAVVAGESASTEARKSNHYRARIRVLGMQQLLGIAGRLHRS